MTAFVTGGGGFIGRHLVRELRAAGTEVRAIARREASAAQLRAAGCEVSLGTCWTPQRFAPRWTGAASRITWADPDPIVAGELGYAPRDLEAGLSATFG